MRPLARLQAFGKAGDRAGVSCPGTERVSQPTHLAACETPSAGSRVRRHDANGFRVPTGVGRPARFLVTFGLATVLKAPARMELAEEACASGAPVW